MKKETDIQFRFDPKGLTPDQVRLLRSINTMLAHLLTTDEEEEFFEGSAELLRMCASIIKQSRITERMKSETSIPYADQALEYSMDMLQEYMTAKKVVIYDN